MSDLGCFGLPSTHNESSDACKSCPHARPCRRAAVQVLQAVRGSVDVSEFVTERYEVPHQAPLEYRVHAAPAKVQPRLRRLLEAKQDVVMQTRLMTGQNPFRESGDVCLYEMGRLLALEGFTRALVVDHLETVHAWKLASARSHVSNCIALLQGLDLIEINGRLIKKNSQIRKVSIPE